MFHCGSAVPMAVARMPTEAEIGPRGLPAPNWPSDHMYIYCEYLICATSAVPTDSKKAQRFVQNPMASGGELDDMRRSLVGNDGIVLGDEALDPASENEKRVLSFVCVLLVILVGNIAIVSAYFW